MQTTRQLEPKLMRNYWFVPLFAIAALAAGFWAWRAGPGDPAASMVQNAAARRQLSRTDEMIASYQEQVRANPSDLDALTILSNAYLQKARETGDPAYYGKADALVSQALQQNPDYVPALIGKGTLLLAQHRFGEALAAGERAVAEQPGVARSYGVIADAQVELGHYEAAVASVQQMVDLRPDLASYSRVAYLRELYGDPEGAIEAMQMAVDARGPTLENTEWARVQLGNLYLGQGDLVAAEREYTLSLSRLPDYVHALAGMARVRLAQGREPEAVELYEQTVERMPLPEFVIALGELYEAGGRMDNAQAQYDLVAAMQQLFRAQGADVDLELAMFEADHGDAARAVELASAAYERRAGIKGAEALAWALFRAGRSAEARPLIEQALSLGTQDATLHARAGLIALATGDANAARAYFDAAATISPHLPPLLAREVMRAQENSLR